MVDFNPARGSEQQGIRPALVISNDRSNQASPVIIVAALTTRIPDRLYPWTVYLPQGQPMDREGLVLCNQVLTVSKERLERYRATLTPAQMQQVRTALMISLGL